MIDEGDIFDLNNAAEKIRDGEMTPAEGMVCLVMGSMSTDQVAFIFECKKKGMNKEETFAAFQEKFPVPHFRGAPKGFFGALGNLAGAMLEKTPKEDE